MKVVGFMGSPRKGGNTDILVQEALRGAKEAGTETSIYNLIDYKIGHCRGCGSCRKPEATSCTIKDDMQNLYPVIKGADSIILGAPIYMGYMSSVATTFLHRWYCLRGTTFAMANGKKYGVILPYARKDPDFFNEIGKWAGLPFELMWAGKVQRLLANGVREKGDVSQHSEHLIRAYEMGKWLATA